MTFFQTTDFEFPLFSLFQYISPLFRENYYFPPTLENLPPVLEKFTCFLHTLWVFRFPPYFDHDALIHHPMHVLDASGWSNGGEEQE